MSLWLSDEFARYWQGQDVFAMAQALDGDVFRDVKGRRTLRFELGGKRWFIKHHQGVGWGEIFKNLITLRLPILGAKNEWLAIQALNQIAVPTMTAAAFAERGWNPARRESFLITEELAPVSSLEEVCAGWARERPAFAFKHRLLLEVARMARVMHSHGICHRDFYLCHFLLHTERDGDPQAAPRLSLIDLHRALIRPWFLPRWIRKDIAGLYFSARDIGLTRTDLCRFIKAYSGKPLRQALQEQGGFWADMQAMADKVWRRELRKQDARLRRRVLQNSAEVICQQSWSQLALINRAHWQPALQAVLDDPDRVLSTGTMLKDGDSTTVVRVNVNNQSWVIKRYNLKTLGYALSRLLRPSRAWQCWASAFRLQQAGIDTPAPLLMIEKRWGPLRRQAYYVSAYVPGQDVLALLGDKPADAEHWQSVMRLFADLFRRLRQHRLIHGDLKATNFIVTQPWTEQARLVVLDLDATRLEHRDARFMKYHQRDLKRFNANWVQQHRQHRSDKS